MKKILKFIIVGLLFGIFPGEIANQIIVHKNIGGFPIMVFFYIILLAFGYFINKFLKKKLFPTLLYFILFGIIGLLIEYFIILSQGLAIGMFTFWAFLFTLPRIFTDESGRFEDLKKKILRYWLISSFIVFLIFLVPSAKVGIYFGTLALIVQLMGFYIFYIPYLIRLHRLSKQ